MPSHTLWLKVRKVPVQATGLNSPMETPQWEPQRLMLLSEMAAMRIWSKARVKKAAKVLQKGTVRSRVAQPTAMLT